MNGEPDSVATPGLATRLLVILGGISLFSAMATDAIAVVGRHIGVPMLGSIEIVQAAVLVSASVGMVMATLARRHAVVHLVIDRLPPPATAIIVRIGHLCAALFFAALTAGSIWIAIEMWSGHEESELLAIPYWPLRIVAILGAGSAALLFLAQTLGRQKP